MFGYGESLEFLRIQFLDAIENISLREDEYVNLYEYLFYESYCFEILYLI